ncbi:MAG TPA: transglutaminaseTgpA domain-containing protein, partial [Acidimicrobiales bacterium]
MGASSAGGVGNVALGALTLASVVALSRLFTHPARFLVPVAVVAVAVHGAAWGCRRARLDLAPSALLCAAAAVVTTSWVALGHTTAYGVPWRGTYHALGPVLQAAADAYRTTSPPTAVITGFVVAGACGAAFAAFLGDWAAFRMRATTEACLPSFSLFVLSGALAQGHAVVLAGAVWLGALLTFLLVRQPPVDGPATAWFASRSRRGPATILVTGGVVAALVVGAVVVVGPHLPGATVHPAFNWRRAESGGAGRTTGSPLVDIKNRLHSESQQEVFTVATGHPTYWRLT